MARPLRIEFAGALCHITSRGGRREAIYEDDDDRGCFGVCWRRWSNATIGSVMPSASWRIPIILSQFGVDREESRRSYRQFVSDGVGRDIWDGLHQQIYLGSEAFVERM